MALKGYLKFVIFGILFPVIFGVAVAGFPPTGSEAAETSTATEDQLAFHLEQTQKGLRPLKLAEAPAMTASAKIYITFYGISFKGIRHYLGTFTSGSYDLVAHVFLPSDAKATVFLLHGYLDHTGILKHLIDLCIRQRYAVAIYDLPGHGLSSGASCSIDDFSEYVSVFDDFMKMCRSRLPGPYYFAGHSTGAAIAIDYLHRVNPKAFDKVIYIAPLVRSAYWKISKAHHYLAKPFIETVPRVFFENSSDPQFNRFLKDDPLQCKEIPLKWIEALFAWNERVEGLRPISQPVLILQGTEDTVVDWEHNIVFLQQKNNLAKVKWFQNGKHHLLNETQVIREEVLKTIRDYFQSHVSETNISETE
jgi:alpha-beta hydrolase superfamily lysophospholipase